MMYCSCECRVVCLLKTWWSCSRWGTRAIDGLHTGKAIASRTETRNQPSPILQHLLNSAFSFLYIALSLSRTLRSSFCAHQDIEMAPPTDRKEILAGFKKQIDSGTAIVGAGAGRRIDLRSEGHGSLLHILIDESLGIGLTAKSAEAGGISLIIIYNRYTCRFHEP